MSRFGEPPLVEFLLRCADSEESPQKRDSLRALVGQYRQPAPLVQPQTVWDLRRPARLPGAVDAMTSTADLAALLESWELALRAERKSPQTVKSYGDGVRRFLGWCAEQGRSPALDRPTVAAFVAALLEAGAEPATARARQLAVRRFSTWLSEEGEIERDELVGIKAPKLDQKVIEPLTDVQIRTPERVLDDRQSVLGSPG